MNSTSWFTTRCAAGILSGMVIFQSLSAQFQYNHPELDWKTFETDHFKIHFYDATKHSALEGATVAEAIYPHVTDLYDYEPPEKTHLIFMDTDDIANGAAYYFDNKIVIWATPLDYALRGSHRWLQDVITHEFTHIITLQKSMKAGMKIPGAYFQYMGYEKEKRPDVLYGFPNTMISYPLPTVSVPPWLAEGTAQYMYPGADWDNWDTHRDMIMRDRVMHGNMLSFPAMNSFGKSGIGNESVYNSGYALTRYIAVKFGTDKLPDLLTELSKPTQYSINRALENVLGIPGTELYEDFKQTLEKRYNVLTESVRNAEHKGRILEGEGTTNIYPRWSPDGSRFAYLSNKGNDYFGQTALYVRTADEKGDTLIAYGVTTPPDWHSDGTRIFYSKRPEKTNRYGSRYYDLFVYDLAEEKEGRLTVDRRAYSPIFIPGDSAIAYIANYDGAQNVYLMDLDSGKVEQLTKFAQPHIIHTLEYDANRRRILFDHTINHFRNIGYFNLADSTQGNLLKTASWDERDMTVSPQGQLLYADDRSGIFNLYAVDLETSQQAYVTNVMGGAFMPDVNNHGQILYSLYENGGYKIALLDSLEEINDFIVGYSQNYYRRNGQLNGPIFADDSSQRKIQPYHDQFPEMFILPKVMVDYGSVKPGFYFYSSEVLNRLSLFGGASVNREKDLDLFFLFEFNRFYPTLFAEMYYLTRNTVEDNQYSVYHIDNNLRFRLIQMRGGLRIPVFGVNILELFTDWQRYRAFIKERINDQAEEGILEAGIAYDYYRGWIWGADWTTRMIKPRADGNINPSNGFRLHARLTVEKNQFIDGLDLSDAGTLTEVFADDDLVRLSADGVYHWSIPHTPRWTFSTEGQIGWVSNRDVDSFFNFFAGGFPGIQGYPFYSIEGKSLAVMRNAFRIPLFREKHMPLGWFIMQNSVVGILYQLGDAWDDHFQLKQSAGIQWRINGVSFYNFPTAIGLEYHRGLTRFSKTIDESDFNYGQENRFYFTLLFGF